MTYILGIDPGLYGAVAVLFDDGRFRNFYDMPIMPNGAGKAKIKFQVNPAALYWIMLEGIGSMATFVAYMENVSSMPRDAQSIAFSLGDSVGAIRGVLASLNIPLTLVRPAEWKREFGLLKKDKQFALTAAQQLYPLAPLHLKKHVNRADALLIARYGLNRLNQNTLQSSH